MEDAHHPAVFSGFGQKVLKHRAHTAVSAVFRSGTYAADRQCGDIVTGKSGLACDQSGMGHGHTLVVEDLIPVGTDKCVLAVICNSDLHDFLQR